VTVEPGDLRPHGEDGKPTGISCRAIRLRELRQSAPDEGRYRDTERNAPLSGELPRRIDDFLIEIEDHSHAWMVALHHDRIKSFPTTTGRTQQSPRVRPDPAPSHNRLSANQPTFPLHPRPTGV
jgi:hypothetical protein